MFRSTRVRAAAVCACFVAIGAPTLWLRYLPMADLPQHVAIVAVLRHLHDPAYDFAPWFEVDLGRSLYLLPYGLSWALSHVCSVEQAMHGVVFLSTVSFPLALCALLCSADRPPELALAAAPFVFNRAFFWGFVNFNLAVGLALLALAAFVRTDTRSTRAWFHGAIIASTLSHVYGLALFVGFVAAWAVTGGWQHVRARSWWLASPVGGACAWWLVGRGADGQSEHIDPPLVARLVDLADAVCGGFADGSDAGLLALGLLLLALLITRTRRAHGWSSFERATALTCAVHFVLYLVLPQATTTAKWIHFRHAFLSVALIPVLVGPALSPLLRAGLPVLALAVGLNAGAHLYAFDAEARGFDEVLAAAPARSRGIALNFDHASKVVKPPVYMHFIAYVQARKGGFVAMSFPQMFWNLPVKVRDDATIPTLPYGFEWSPRGFDDAALHQFFDWALVRIDKGLLPPTETFPFERSLKVPPWQIYRRRRAP